MNNRHRKSLEHPLVTKVVSLNLYLVEKSSQARKLVQVNYINSILSKGSILFDLAMDYIDGLDTRKRMQECVYSIQRKIYLIAAIESNECRKRTAQGKKVEGGQSDDSVSNDGGHTKRKYKHYGFDTYACSFIDDLCQNLITEISTYKGQLASGGHHNKGN